MADGVKIEIVSPERLVLSEQAKSVVVPGADGYFTVMGEHAPLMSTLKPGFITVTDMNNVAHVFFVKGGFADVAPTGLTILAEEARPLAEFSRTDVEALIASGMTAVQAAPGFFVTLDTAGEVSGLPGRGSGVRSATVGWERGHRR